jgi:glutamate/tyrosine decarboxylase-like PLP-dependent enzyme
VHDWDAATELLASSVIGYAVERLTLSKDPQWGARPAEHLDEQLAGAICPEGRGGHAALALFRDVLLPACRPMDDPRMLAYVPTAPTPAANLFDLVVSASSIFAGHWESGAGAIAAENQALRWLATLAGFPDGAGGCFVTGGSAANLAALVAARHRHRRRGGTGALRFATTGETHTSVRAAARVMDVGMLEIPPDDRGRLTGAALRAALAADATDGAGVFAVVANVGTTNVGAIDELDAIADVCSERGWWMHVDAAYGGATLCAPSMRAALRGFERADSFGVDPHKWLFAPYDAAALVYREPQLAAEAHAQHAEYLDAIDRGEWNPADYAFHLSRRARGLPLWFSLVTYGTDTYADAVEQTLDVARAVAADLRTRAGFTLLLEPQTSVVLFTVDGWDPATYRAWTASRARAGVALVIPTTWRGETCYRICIVNPRTTIDIVRGILDDMAAFTG